MWAVVNDGYQSFIGEGVIIKCQGTQFVHPPNCQGFTVIVGVVNKVWIISSAVFYMPEKPQPWTCFGNKLKYSSAGIYTVTVTKFELLEERKLTYSRNESFTGDSRKVAEANTS